MMNRTIQFRSVQQGRTKDKNFTLTPVETSILRLQYREDFLLYTRHNEFHRNFHITPILLRRNPTKVLAELQFFRLRFCFIR